MSYIKEQREGKNDMRKISASGVNLSEKVGLSINIKVLSRKIQKIN
jgi:hypothetical protein